MADRTPDIAGLTIAPNAPGDLQNPAASGGELKVHRFWGRYDQVSQLPNNPGNLAGSPAFDLMRPGDAGFVQTGANPGAGTLYYLLDRGTVSGGNAIWVQLQSGVDLGGQLSWGNTTVASSTTTRYLEPWFSDGIAPTTPIQFEVTRAATLRNMRVRHNNPGGTGAIITYTLRVNGVATALSVGLASTSATGSDLVNSVAVAAGDTLDVEVTKAAAAGGGSRIPMVEVEMG